MGKVSISAEEAYRLAKRLEADTSRIYTIDDVIQMAMPKVRGAKALAQPQNTKLSTRDRLRKKLEERNKLRMLENGGTSTPSETTGLSQSGLGDATVDTPDQS